MDNDYLTPVFINKQVVRREEGWGAVDNDYLIYPPCRLTNKLSRGRRERGDYHKSCIRQQTTGREGGEGGHG